MNILVIIAMTLFLMAAGSFTISFFQLKGKGFLFHNAYLWASQAERRTMDKKPYYRQSAVVFALVGTAILLLGLWVLFDLMWLGCLFYVVIVIALVYAVVSSVRIEKKKK